MVFKPASVKNTVNFKIGMRNSVVDFQWKLLLRQIKRVTKDCLSWLNLTIFLLHVRSAGCDFWIIHQDLSSPRRHTAVDWAISIFTISQKWFGRRGYWLLNSYSQQQNQDLNTSSIGWVCWFLVGFFFLVGLFFFSLAVDNNRQKERGGKKKWAIMLLWKLIDVEHSSGYSYGNSQ